MTPEPRDDAARLHRRLERERRARVEAEHIAERATRELYGMVFELEKLKQVLDTTTDLVMIISWDGAVHYSNEACRRFFGWQVPEPRTRLHDVCVDWAVTRVVEQVVPALHADGVWSGELELTGVGGTTMPVSQVVVLHGPTATSDAYLSVIARDVSTHKSLERQLAHLAQHDHLTGLPNRALFTERVHQAATTRPGEGLTAVLFIDVDDFKTVNDTMGHAAGDELLRSVADRVRRGIRPQDLAARLGGDEFAALLTGVRDRHEASDVAGRVLHNLQETCLIRGRDVHISGSIGVAVQPGPRWSPDDLLHRADVAMYQAKSRGKDCYEVYEPAMEAPTAPTAPTPDGRAPSGALSR